MKTKIVYKLTTQALKTHGGFKWTPKKWAPKTDGKEDLCSPSWYHFYSHPLLAVLLNPIHANLSDPLLWKAEARGKFKDDRGLKGGCTQLRIMTQMDLPQVTTIQRVAFALLCAKEVYKDASFVHFADSWLKGEDRSYAAAAAADAARYARYAADAARYAARYAADAARYAARYAAARYADAAAADAARYARYAADAAKKINLVKLAKQAMQYT